MSAATRMARDPLSTAFIHAKIAASENAAHMSTMLCRIHTTASAAELERENGIDRKTLNKALGRLCEAGRLERVGRGVYRLRGDKNGL